MVNQKGIYEKVEKFVNSEIEKWQQKGRYEKVADYQARVTEEKRKAKIEQLTQQKVNELANEVITLKVLNVDYDADNEVFKVALQELQPIYFKVPVSNGEAESFDKNLAQLKFNNLLYTITSNNDFALLEGEMVNPTNNKRYKYDSQQLIKFKQQNIVANFGAVKVNVTKEFNQLAVNESTENITIGKADVDINIPQNRAKNENRYALIIGNEDYSKYQNDLNSEVNVDFARNDAATFAKYCEQTLGLPKENIVLLTDAISSQMKREIDKLVKLAGYSNGQAELIFYYAGHGFPDEISKESYIMPVDISGSDVTAGIKLSGLYQQLTSVSSKRVSVFLDACFSGGGRNQGLLAARGVKVQPKADLVNGNLVVFSASSGMQSSLPYKEKQHGMFTYFLLKKLQETSGNITYKALSDYIKQQVQLNSVKFNSKDQNPETLISPYLQDNWMNWNMN